MKRSLRLFFLMISSLYATNEITFLPMTMPFSNADEFSYKARSETLLHLDRLLEWFAGQLNSSYRVKLPPVSYQFHHNDPSLTQFIEDYGYFSKQYPLIGSAQHKEGEIPLIEELFRLLDAHIEDPMQRKIAIAEALSKALAYRDLQEGQTLSIPDFEKKGFFISYRVSIVFDLWQEMPAFGLVPIDHLDSPSILLFRGTDLSLAKRSGWASVAADFDLTGPGYTVFQYSRESISNWLKSSYQQGRKTAVFGFSLGGIMAMYTALFEAQFLEGVMAFNPPGISRELVQRWGNLEDSEKVPLSVFVNKGDAVSRWGYLIGDSFELRAESMQGPIKAHNLFVSGEPCYEVFQIDVLEENKSRGI